jgi:hypothetical protein
VPSTILQDAVADTRARRFAEALGKHLWYHRHALKYDGGLYGVRLSFALMYWRQLAHQYPPAMAALRQARDDAELAALAEEPPGSNGRGNHPFHDAVAISRELNENDRVVALFKKLDVENPELARQAYHFADDFLIEAEEYELCGRYLDPEKMFSSLQRRLELGRRQPRSMAWPVTVQHIQKDAANVVALLARNGRPDEAKVFAERSKALLDNPEFHERLDRAVRGEFSKR